jgi:hypothetical protein
MDPLLGRTDPELSSNSADRGRSIIRVIFHAEKKILVSMSEEI